MDSVSILVDVQNVYYTTKQAYGRNFNYNEFWKKATNNRKVIKAVAYAIDRGDKKQMQFQNILKAIGFEIKLKPFIQRSDGSAKGDWDVGLALVVVTHWLLLFILKYQSCQILKWVSFQSSIRVYIIKKKGNAHLPKS